MAYARFCVFLRQSIKVAFMACQKAFRLTWSVVPMCLCQTHLQETPTDACDGWQVLTEELAKEKHQKQVPGQRCVFLHMFPYPYGGLSQQEWRNLREKGSFTMNILDFTWSNQETWMMVRLCSTYKNMI